MKSMKIMKIATFLLIVMSVNVWSMEDPEAKRLLEGRMPIYSYLGSIESNPLWGEYAEMLLALRTADYSTSDRDLYYDTAYGVDGARYMSAYFLSQEGYTMDEAIQSIINETKHIIWLNYNHLKAAIRRGVIKPGKAT